jgi:hypothetical protein
MTPVLRCFLSLLILAALPGLLPAQSPAPGPTPAPDPKAAAAPHVEAAGALLKAPKPDVPKAREEYAKALAVPGLPALERTRIRNLAADGEKRLGAAGLAEAGRLYESIASDPEAPNKARIAALNSLANVFIAGLAGQNLDEMDLPKAEAILRRSFDLPDLKPDEASEAWVNLAKLQERQDHYAEARDSYAKSGRTNAAPGSLSQTSLRESCLAVLNDPKADAKARWNAFMQLPSWSGRDYDAVLEDAKKWLPGFLAADANQAIQLLRKFKEAGKGDAAYVDWAGPLLLAAPRLSSNDYALVRTTLLKSLATQRKIPAAAGEAAAMAGDAKLSPALRFQAGLSAAALKAPGRDAKKGIEEAAKGFTLTVPEKSQAILEAARIALMAGLESPARALFGAYQGYFVQPGRASLACPFVDKAPIDVGAWVTSAIVKDPKRGARLDRPYGDNLKFLLETDSAVTSRNIGPDTASGVADDSRTDFHAVCDPEGVHLFFMAWDSKAADVVNGFVTGGSYEGYLAAGRYEPYTFFSIELPNGELNDRFDTVYANRFVRTANEKAGTLRSETRVVEGGFATHLFFSWEAYYDRIPVNGTAWAVENIRWTRAGGRSFGGSESVHNPTSWGDLVFGGLDPQAKLAIKRRLVIKAAAAYARLKRNAGGPVSLWQDRELGDPAFYTSQLRPLVERLDAYAKQVNADMTAEQVETLFSVAVPGWYELPRIADSLRRDYLAARLTSPEAAPKP